MDPTFSLPKYRITRSVHDLAAPRDDEPDEISHAHLDCGYMSCFTPLCYVVISFLPRMVDSVTDVAASSNLHIRLSPAIGVMKTATCACIRSSDG